MRILLVSPRSEKDVTNSIVRNIPFLLHRKSGAQIAPLAAVTVAALTPPEHEVLIHDEHFRGPVEPVLEKRQYDVVGISMIVTQFTRASAIVRHCRDIKLHAKVVVGGPGTAVARRDFRDMVDAVFFGEAEETWPQFLRDLASGQPQKYYQQISKPDMSKSPVPRWDLIRSDLPHYLAGAVQTCRGCPCDCDFCDVIYLYGRSSRSKTREQVLKEIQILESMGVRDVFISDDNFAVNKSRAKDLLRALGPLNNSFKLPLRFVTQCDITIANDEELLELMADANLIDVLVGIESVNQQSLRDLNKQQNLKMDLPEAVRKVQSYGIAVLASMIIGSDSDDTQAFQQTADFVQQANITEHVCHPLIAPRGTRIWYRLARQRRIVQISGGWDDKVDILTNIVPKRVTRVELMEGLADYWERVFDPLNYMERALRFIRGVRRRPRVKRNLFRALWRHRKMLRRMIRYYARRAPPDHRKAFFTVMRTAIREAPFLLPQMIFLHTRFLINHERVKIGARVAREQAAMERTHQDCIRIADLTVPIPESVEQNAKAICDVAYARVRSKVSDREMLYRVVLDALVDYVDRFGESLERFDGAQSTFVQESCDRALGRFPLPEFAAESDLPEDHPPAGFARSMLDGLDHALFVRAPAGSTPVQ